MYGSQSVIQLLWDSLKPSEGVHEVDMIFKILLRHLLPCSFSFPHEYEGYRGYIMHNITTDRMQKHKIQLPSIKLDIKICKNVNKKCYLC